jgi:hypothetical protein
MRHLRRTAVLVVLAAFGLSALLTSPSAALAATSTAHGRVTPADRADGMTGQQLLAQAWTGFYETSTTAPPVDCMYVGRTGKVLLAGRVDLTCPVKLGSPVMYFFGSTCDPISTPPFFAVTARDQRRCARAADLDFIAHMSLQVDDGPVVKITTPRFELFTGQKSVVVPEDNIFGAPPGPTTFTAHAWAAFADHLSLGLHTTHFTVVFTDGSTDTADRPIEVVR